MNLAAITDPVVRHPRSLRTFRPNPLTHPSPATNATLLIAPQIMVQADRQIRNEQYARALRTLNLILELREAHDLALPGSRSG